MNENNGFILKPEMYSQQEWYKMFMGAVETNHNLQSKIDKAINKIENIKMMAEFDNCKVNMILYEVQEILEEDK